MDIVDKIEGKIKRNFSITSCPLEVIKEFKKFCRDECGDVYAVGLLQLLKIKNQYENLLPLLSQIYTEVEEIKQTLNSTQLNKSRRFG